MISLVEDLRSHFLTQSVAQFVGIKAIKVYQNTLSRVIPSRCRYTPSCSQYGIDAITEWGLIEGIKLTRQRIKRCHRPNGGFDPVPSKRPNFVAAKKVGKKHLDSSNFKFIKQRNITDNFIDYEHHFRLILSYPKEREFISMQDFQDKILELNQYIFEVPNYALLYRIANIEIGAIDDYYLLRFAGTISDLYLKNSVGEVIGYIIEQLAGFLLAARAEEFEPLYFQVDGQAYIEPEPEHEAVPATYQYQQDFWDYISDAAIWDVYWGNFVFDVVEGVVEVSGLVDNFFSSDIESNLVGTEDITGNACDFEGCGSGGCDGCDSGGCDGCDSGGCDGCDGCGGW